MSSLQTKKKMKTGIPVMKITPRNDDENSESVTACSHAQNLQSESVQSRNQNVSVRNNQQQLSHFTSVVSSKPTKKVMCPETWADELIESHSQKFRNVSISESKRRHDDMEKHLKEAEIQLATMGNLLEQRDKMMKEAAEEADKKTAELELKLLNQDGHMIKHGIDPVTGEQIMLDEEGEKKVESVKKITKKRVKEMRETLKQMNNQTESYLSDIENTLQFLNNLESASERLGQLSNGALTKFDEAFFNVDKKILDKNQQIWELPEMTSTERAEDEIQDEMTNVNLGAVEGDNSNLFYDGTCKSHAESRDNDNNENDTPNEVS